MKNADKFVVGGLVYDVLSPATFGDYMETIGSACINPDGYAENKLFLAYDDNVQKLFRATTAIANSELLIKDTNCEPTTMAEALANALSAGGVSYDNTDSGLTASNVQDAIDEVNGDVETVNSDLANEVSARATLGAHNLLSEKFTSQVGSHYILSVDDDGICTITTDGTTPTEMFTPTIYPSISFPYDVILSGCPSGGGGGTYQLDANGGSYEDTGNGVLIPANTTITQIRIRIASGYVPTPSLVIKPMICLATDIDLTYQPYAMTNRELTTKINQKTDNVIYDSGTDSYVFAMKTVNNAAQGFVGVAQMKFSPSLGKMFFYSYDGTYMGEAPYTPAT